MRKSFSLNGIACRTSLEERRRDAYKLVEHHNRQNTYTEQRYMHIHTHIHTHMHTHMHTHTNTHHTQMHTHTHRTHTHTHTHTPHTQCTYLTEGHKRVSIFHINHANNNLYLYRDSEHFNQCSLHSMWGVRECGELGVRARQSTFEFNKYTKHLTELNQALNHST